MAIDKKRIEAARDRLQRRISNRTFHFLTNDETEALVVEVAAILFPELSSDPPTGWVAPMTPSDAMQADMRDAIGGWLPRGEVSKPVTDQWQIGREVYEAARDAHTKEQT